MTVSSTWFKSDMYFSYLKFISLLLLFFTVGCSGPVSRQLDWANPAIDKVWPAPPEIARIRLLRTLSAKDLIDYDSRQSRMFRWVAGEDSEIVPLVTPYGVAVNGQGMVWVTDPGNSLVHAFDLTRGRVDYLSTAGQFYFQTPSGIFFDSVRKHLYIADSTLARVFQFDAAGKFLRQFGSPEIFGRPAGLTVDSQGNLLVADVVAGVIHRFSSAGKALSPIGSSLTGDGQFRRPLAVSVDGRDNVYVLDSLNFRVEILTPAGESIGAIGSLGDVPGSFSRPRGLALDSQGRIYVSDAAFDNIQIFNLEGQLLLHFGRDKKWPLSLPAGIVTDSAGRIIVADSYNHRLQFYQLLEP